jgi:integrase
LDGYQDQGSEDPYSIFVFAMNAPQTREKYTTRLDRFFRFINVQGDTIQERCKAFAEISKNDNVWALYNVRKFLQVYKERVERKEITGATIRNYVKSIKLFCEMNDILIPWKKITRGLPRGRRYAEDRAPTIEEIRRVIEYPDRRIKAIVFTMVSSGIRVGAWDYLQWRHITPIERNAQIVAAKITVYAGSEEEYFSFITPEAYRELHKWMIYRKESGETIDCQSWVMRNIWDTKRGYMKGLVTAPKKLKHSGVKRLMEDALWTQGLRKRLEQGKRRHEFQADHGFRKWFKTHCQLARMDSINIEELMNHSTGISDSYYRPTELHLLEDYLKAVDLLTINEDPNILHRKAQELKEKSKDNEYIIKAKLQEKDDAIQFMKEKYDTDIALLKDAISDMQQLLKNPEKLIEISKAAAFVVDR